MKNIFMAFLVLGVCLSKANAQKASGDAAINAEALAKTQEMLRDPKLRNAGLDTPAAKNTAQQVSVLSMGNPEIENQLYNISADLMTLILSDPELLSKLIQNPGGQDPEFVKKFYEKIPAAQREQIRSLASQIEALRNSKSKTP